MLVKVNPNNNHEKNRIISHGDTWICLEQNKRCIFDSFQNNWSLLKSVKTGYLKWWRDDQIIPLDVSM